MTELVRKIDLVNLFQGRAQNRNVMISLYSFLPLFLFLTHSVSNLEVEKVIYMVEGGHQITPAS